MDNQPIAPAAAAAPTQVPVVPSSWPGAFGALKHSKAVVLVNVWAILGLSILTLLLSGGGRNEGYTGASAAASLIGALLSFWVNLALMLMYLAGAKGEKLSFVSSMKKAGHFYLRYIGVAILSGLLAFLSLLALIIPFFFVLPRLVLASYYLVDRDLGVVDSISLSWKETKGHSLKVWGIIGVTVLFAILCVVLIGFYFLFFYQAAFAVLYFFIKKNQTATAETPVAASATPPGFPEAPVAQTPQVAPTITDPSAPNTVSPEAAEAAEAAVPAAPEPPLPTSENPSTWNRDNQTPPPAA